MSRTTAEQDVRRCAVLGSPISHSLSPVIHRAAYRYLGLAWEYTSHEVDEAGLGGFVAGLDGSWRGLSLTMPLKRAVLDVADDVSDLARAVGAANTLVRAAGGWFADNTDVPGAAAALNERGVSRPGAVCVWGGGATAASVLAALASMRSGRTHLHARSLERARPALDVAYAMGGTAEAVSWKLSGACADAELVVNTAPAGAVDEFAADLASQAHPGRALFDVLYDPWPTPLAAAWAEHGAVVVGGLDLLIHQALGQLALMTGRDVPTDVVRAAAEAALEARARK